LGRAAAGAITSFPHPFAGSEERPIFTHNTKWYYFVFQALAFITGVFFEIESGLISGKFEKGYKRLQNVTHSIFNEAGGVCGTAI
jgi:hypothetical protein